MAYAEQRDKRSFEIETRIDDLVADAYLAHNERPNLAAYKAALEGALFDPLSERARDLATRSARWLKRWKSAWSCSLLAPVREAGLVGAIDSISLQAPLVPEKIVRALWLTSVGGRPAQVERPEGQARTAYLALEGLQASWAVIGVSLPLAESAPELELCRRLAVDVKARFPRSAEFRHPSLDLEG